MACRIIVTKIAILLLTGKVINAQDDLDITLLRFKNQQNKPRSECHALTNAANDALTWKGIYTSQENQIRYNDYHTENPPPAQCRTLGVFCNVTTDWSLSPNFELDVPVPAFTDVRWEYLPVYYTTNAEREITSPFRARKALFSVKGYADAYVYLFNSVTLYPRLQLVLGGWPRSEPGSVLQICNSPNHGLCTILGTKLLGNPLSSTEWRHFVMKINKSAIIVESWHSEPGISYTWTNLPHDVRNYNQLMFHTGAGAPYDITAWKFHNRELFYIRRARGVQEDVKMYFNGTVHAKAKFLCISFWYYMTAKPGLRLQVAIGKHEVVTMESSPDEKPQWKRFVREYQSSNANEYVDIHITGIISKSASENAIISLDDFRKCGERGDISHYSTFGNTANFVKCSPAFKNPLTRKPCDVKCRNGGDCVNERCQCPPGFTGTRCQKACDENHFGKNCSGICRRGGSSCSGIEVCTVVNGTCGCAAGFRGNQCTDACNWSNYGFDCKEKCSDKCNTDIKGNSCHSRTGKCIDGCTEGYLPDKCIAEYSYLKHQATLVTASDNSIEISIRLGSDNYVGGKDPIDFQVQFKKSAESSWTVAAVDSIPFPMDKNYPWNYTIRNLTQGTNYDIRVLLHDTDVPLSANQSLIQVAIFKTTGIFPTDPRPASPPVAKNNTKTGATTNENDTDTEIDYLLISMSILAVLVAISLVIFILYCAKRGSLCKSKKNIRVTVGLQKRYSRLILSVKRDDPADESLMSCPVALGNISGYVQEATASGELEKQFKSLPRGAVKSTSCGQTLENKAKNRHENIIAYNDTRVWLSQLGGDEYSDYINANYINSNSREKSYIAAQGPLPNTVDDFWRMIWRGKVQLVVMMTNLTEHGQTKCEKYWPKLGDTVTYGGVSIKCEHITQMADYTFRTLTVTKAGGNKRLEVTHAHYLSWSSEQVPAYPESVASFAKELLLVRRGRGPTLVHSSSGTGRAGTMIMIDSLLRMASTESRVDIWTQFHRCRRGRVNMVTTLEQYKFVHVVLANLLDNKEDSVIPCSELEARFQKMCDRRPDTGATELKAEYRAMHKQTLSYVINAAKLSIADLLFVRVKDVVPGHNSRLFIHPHDGGDDVQPYFNGTYVDGFQVKNRYITTQLPLPSTQGHFWQMIYEHNVHTVILLQQPDTNDPDQPIFWPTSGSVKFGNVIVRASEENWTTSISVKEFLIRHNSQQTEAATERTVRFIHLLEWNDSANCPNPEGIVNMYVTLSGIHKVEDTPIVVVCRDGASGCGVFVTASYVIEMMQSKREVDVFLTTKMMRQRHFHFVSSPVQYEFLYKAALLYLSYSQSYANL